MERLFKPRSIAVVGASPKGGYGFGVIEGNRALGFDGDLYVVHPRADEVGGVKAYRSLSDLPEVPDAVSIAVPARAVPAVVQEAADLGVGGAVVYASGFAELGDEGVALQEQIVATCRGRMPLIGPNCLGAVSYGSRASLWAGGVSSEHVDPTGVVALAAQSGNIALTSMGAARIPSLAYSVSMGNQAVSDITDCLEYFISDEQVRIIALVIEGLADLERFRRLALEAAARDTAIVALKVGRSKRGEAATLAHTGTLAGTDGAYDALFRQTGVIRVKDLEELSAVCNLLAGPYEITGRTAGIFASSGGECGLMADLAEDHAIDLPVLEAGTQERLRSLLPEYGYVTNPFDLTAGGWGHEHIYHAAAKALAQNRGVDFVAFVGDAPAHAGSLEEMAWPEMVVGAGRAARDTQTPVILISTITETGTELPQICRENGVVYLAGADQAMGAIALVADRHRAVRRLTAGSAAEPTAASHVETLVPDGGSAVLSETASKAMLNAYGIATPGGGVATTPDEAVKLGADLGYPVVAKLVAEGLAHKSDIGGVVVDIAGDDELRTAAADVLERGRAAVGDAVRGVRIEQMIRAGNGVEMIIGGHNDVSGSVVVVGTGGVLTELLADAATLLWPFDGSDVEEALGTLRVDRLLRGYRGAPAVDRDALVSTVVQVGRMLHEHPEISELDINPLLCGRGSAGSTALDALITLCNTSPLEQENP
jgi:acyl-CoA synthetase (NDP forming)